MKVSVIAGSRIPSNTANSIQTMKVCQSLKRLGHEVRLYVPGTQTESWDKLATLYGIEDQFEISWLAAPLVWKRYDFIWKSIQQSRWWGAELVYTWMSPAAALALHYNKAAILEIHDRPTGRLGPIWLKSFIKLPGKKRLLPITHALNAYLNDRFIPYLSPKEVMVAPMGTEPERYETLPNSIKARSLLGLPNQFTAGYTGHLYPGRGADMLFELARRIPEAHFLWVGGNPQDVAYWKKRLDEAEMNNVTLTGFVDNQKIPIYQAAADVLLMPYERVIEVSGGGNTADFCSPMKMFDYLCAGRAIISSDLPVLREILNTENAVLCSSGDVNAWYTALKDLMNDPNKRDRLASRAKNDALNFTWLDRTQRSLEGF